MEVLLKKRPAAPRGGGSSKAPEPLQLQLVVQWYQAVVVEVAPGVGGGDGVTWRDVRHTDRLCFGAAGEGEGGGAQGAARTVKDFMAQLGTLVDRISAVAPY